MSTKSEQDDRPKKKKKKAAASGSGMVIGLAAAGIGLAALLILLGVGAFVWPGFARSTTEDKKLAADKPPGQKPGQQANQDAGEDKKRGKPGGGGLVQNIHAAARRPQRLAEMAHIGRSFYGFCDETPKSGRTLDNFVKSLQKEGTQQDVLQALRDGYYQVNFKANHTMGEAILAYERDQDAQGYLCAKSNNYVGFVSEQELKSALQNP